MGSIDELAPLTSSETDACQVLLTAPRLALSVPTLHIHTYKHTLSLWRVAASDATLNTWL